MNSAVIRKLGYCGAYIFIALPLFALDNLLNQNEFSPPKNQWGKPFFEASTRDFPKELQGRDWDLKTSFTFSSELPDQQAGILLGDQNKHLRLVVGRLMVTQGVAFNIGFYQTGVAPQFSPLKSFSSGGKVYFRIFKKEGAVTALYSLDGKTFSFAGKAPASTIDESRPIGFCLVDENRFDYQKRVLQGSVAMVSAKLHEFKVLPLNASDPTLSNLSRVYARLVFLDLPADQNRVKVACTLMEAQHARLARWGLRRSGGVNALSTELWHPIPWKEFSESDSFQKGEQTPWIDISSYFSNGRLHTVMAWSFAHGHQPIDSGEDSGDLKNYHVRIDFSTRPEDAGIVHRVEQKADFHRLALLVPANEGSPHVWLKGIRSFTQYSQDILNAYHKQGMHSLREQALKSSFLFQGNMHDGVYLFGSLLDPQAIRNFLKVGEFLGYNSNEHYVWPPWHPQFGYGKNDPTWKDIWKEDPQKRFEAYLQDEHRRYKEGWNRYRTDQRSVEYQEYNWDIHRPTFVKVGDEPHIFGPEVLKKSPEGIKIFRQYLQGIHSDPESWGARSWSQIEPLLKNEIKTQGEARRFYHQAYFLQNSFHQMHAAYSKAIRHVFGPSAQTGTANYWAGFNISPDYFLEAKTSAFGIAMHHYGSGDTIGPRQTNADLWMSEMLRSAASFGKIRQGILWFICRIADEDAVRLSGLTAVSRGTQNIHFYGYGPRWTGWEWFVDDFWKVGTVKAAHDTVRMMLDFEKVLIHGKRPSAMTAVGLSRGTSIWANVESDQMVQIFGYTHEKENRKNQEVQMIPAEGWNLERRMIHNALQWKNIETDLLPEEEIEQGRIQDYQVLYWTDPHLSLLAREKLEKWVRGGGVLYLGPQAATRDETNELNPWIERLSKGTVSLERQEVNRVFKKYGGYQEVWETSSQYDQEDVDSLTSLGHFKSLSGKGWDALGIKERIQISEATPLALDQGEIPCYVKLSYGKGRIYKSGISFGVLYAKSAMPRYRDRKGEEPAPHTFINSASTSFLLKKHDSEIQDLILLPVTERFDSFPVQSSIRGIDAKLYEDNNSAALFLGKWTTESTSSLEMKVQLQRRYKTVTLWSGKKVSVKWNGLEARIQFPLKITEVVSFTNP